MQETAKLFGLAFGVLFLCALIGGIGTTLLLHTSFSGTFLRTLYLGFFGALPVAVFQGRVTDHRINLTLHKLDFVMDGDLEEITNALIAEHQAELLAAMGD